MGSKSRSGPFGYLGPRRFTPRSAGHPKTSHSAGAHILHRTSPVTAPEEASDLNRGTARDERRSL
jgi:hypothetical protein